MKVGPDNLVAIVTKIATDTANSIVAATLRDNQFTPSKIADHHHNGVDSIQVWGGDISGTLQGSGAPSSTPTFVGQMYIDTANTKVYIATASTSSASWTLMN